MALGAGTAFADGQGGPTAGSQRWQAANGNPTIPDSVYAASTTAMFLRLNHHIHNPRSTNGIPMKKNITMSVIPAPAAIMKYDANLRFLLGASNFCLWRDKMSASRDPVAFRNPITLCLSIFLNVP